MNPFVVGPDQALTLFPDVGSPFGAMFFLFLHGGWIIVIIVSLWGGWEGWVLYIQNKYQSKIPFVLLAIDIPRGNEQSPKAVEHIFSHIFGFIRTYDLYERFVEGKTQLGVSLEIVSIEGYIQFLIRTPVKFRDLVEAAIYAQYPEAEITEVEDYIDMLPKPLELPHPEYDVWGTEFKLAHNYLYPIKTYPNFEHSLSQKFLDPMASLMEILSRMGPGEHLWYQLVISPVTEDWKQKGISLINKLIGKKDGAKSVADWLYFPREIGKGLSESFTASIIPPTEMEGPQRQRNIQDWPSQMQHLSPAERDIVEAIGMKISKIGYESKLRMIYGAKKKNAQLSKGLDGVIGTVHQFAAQNTNGFRPDMKTFSRAKFLFAKSRLLARKRRLLWSYRYRSLWRGRKNYVLNIEELATIWHFPIIDVKVPSVQKVDSKKAQAPIDLPLEQAPERLGRIAMPPAEQKGVPPPNLPTA
ncbi:MAG: hypothetical protein WC505_02745 [Patescibacteria group bacterium]